MIKERMRSRGFRRRGLAVLFLAVLPGVVAGARSERVLRNVKIGEVVPDFFVVDLNGEQIDKEMGKGRVLLVLFVRPAQEASLDALKIVERVQRDRRDSPNLLAFAVSTKPDSAAYFQELAAKQGLTVRIAQDPGRKMYGDFGVIVTPTTLLIDEAGVLRYELPHMPVSYERKLGLHADVLSGKITPEEHDALLARAEEGSDRRHGSVETRLALARALLEGGDLEAALGTVQALAAEHGESPAMAALRGTILLRLGRTVEAAECLDRHAGVSEPPSELERARARLEIHRENLAGAETHLLGALRRSAEKGPVLYELGLLYERMDRPQEALARYREALGGIYGDGF
ncbi:MAG: redoxin domain-containing protein [Planctomycetota bacterium]